MFFGGEYKINKKNKRRRSMKDYDNEAIIGKIFVNESVMGTHDQEKVKKRAGQTVTLLPKYNVNGQPDRMLVELVERDNQDNIIRFSVPKDCIMLSETVRCNFQYLVDKYRQVARIS